jgi:threonine dehydrogenase-like Zn-dependent dehydrogenase
MLPVIWWNDLNTANIFGHGRSKFMTDQMKAVVWDGTEYPSSLSYRNFDAPDPEPGWVVVNTKAAGICGSDLHYLLGYTRHLIPDKNLPAVLGHENAGVVVRVGEGVTSVKPGDRVAVEPLHGCMEFGRSCPMCRIGKYHLCQYGLTHVGIPIVRMLPGGYGEYSVAHESRLFHIPDNVTFEEAALLDILAVDVHAVKITKPTVGDTAAVLGCGIIGLDMIQTLRAEGVADIIAVAKYDFQAEAAKRLGAKEIILLDGEVNPVEEVMKLTDNWGIDQVYECVGGNTDALDQAVAMCRPGGNAVMLGVFSGHRPIDLLTMLLKEVNILSSNSYSTAGDKREFQISMDLLANGLIDHQSLVTHRFSPKDYKLAIDLAIEKGENKSIKTMFIRD